MGAICSAGTASNRSPSNLSFRAIAFVEKEFKPYSHGKLRTKHKNDAFEEMIEQSGDQPSHSFEKGPVPSESSRSDASYSKEEHLSRIPSDKPKVLKSKLATIGKSGTTKGSEVSSRFGRASTTGIGKAVEVLDTLGSSMTSLNASGGFASGMTSKGNKITMLAFEIANTIVKGVNIMQSLSKEKMAYLKEVVLLSEGVQCLVSSDVDELLRIAAADKRQEFLVFSREVIRFGNRCKDPQLHNLDRYFAKIESETAPLKELKETATIEIQRLMMLVQSTAELYHEMQALDRFEQDYRRKLKEEEDSVLIQRGDTLQMLKQELKSQRDRVKNLKRKSLWCKTLEDVVEKLVDIVLFIHLEINDAFQDSDEGESVSRNSDNYQKLGSAGLALHYANIISTIDVLASRSSSVPPSSRDTLYQGLPPAVKLALRTKLLTSPASHEFTLPQIRTTMERTLLWLVPIANNTMRAHHGFGYVGEWANSGIEASRKMVGLADVIKIETLYHADKEKTEAFILDLVVGLHHLVSQTRHNSNAGSHNAIRCSPPQKRSMASIILTKPGIQASILTIEDEQMLRELNFRKMVTGKSKSQDLDAAASRLRRLDRMTKSSSNSPSKESTGGVISTARPLIAPAVDLDIDRIKDLDVFGRVEILKKL